MGGSGRKLEPLNDTMALVRARAAAQLVVHEYTICRDRHDQLLDESDQILNECEDLESCIAIAEARVAAAHLAHYQDWSVHGRVRDAPPDLGSIVSEVCEAVTPSRKHHLEVFEQQVHARHLTGIADTLNALQAASYQAGVHGEDVL